VTGTQGSVGALLVVLAFGLVLRLILTYLLPTAGFGVDLGAFRFWASDLAAHGPHGFYDRPFLHDYTPGYLYVLWLVGIIGKVLGGVSVGLVKIPAILADLAIGYLVWSMLLELGTRRTLALAAAFVAVVNPISWFDSAVWGQVDSVGVVFLLLGLREIWHDRPERAAIFTVIAAVIKPQLGILIPILALVTIRRALWPIRDPDALDESGRAPVTGPWARLRAWERRTDHPVRILTTAATAAITTVALCFPFALSVVEFTSKAPFLKSGLLAQILATASGYPYLAVNAFNPWALIPGDAGYSLANSGLWACDGPWGSTICGEGTVMFGPIPAVLVGSVLMLVVTAAIALAAALRPDRKTILLCLTLLALAFFVVPTRVHERYAYPVFALAIMLAAVALRWRIAYLVLSVTIFLNMYAELTNPFYKNPGIVDWLGISPQIRTFEGIALIALLNLAVFVWALTQLRAAARERLEEEYELASDDEWLPEPTAGWAEPAREAGAFNPTEPSFSRREALLGDPPGAAGSGPAPWIPPATSAAVAAVATVATMPTWTLRPSFEELGLIGWFKARFRDPPIRPDRTATIRHEGGGRLDRLDLWFVVVLVVGTLVLRTFRLEEPYQMHFDEVYHARTATEFLQDWRYGISHDIYEWTHPHLAKYLMAAGIVAWGEDHVSTTSDLGVTVRAAAVEPRREAGPVATDASPNGSTTSAAEVRAGERLHVATGSEIRTYDLRTRALISVVAAPGAAALAIDETGNQLVIGYDDGRLATLDLDLIGAGGVATGLQPEALVTVDHPVTRLFVTSGGAQVMAASAGRLTSVDLDRGSVVGSLDLPGIADMASGGSGSVLIATVGEVTKPSAEASSIADILNTDDAGEIEAKIAAAASASPGTTVILGSPGSGDARTALDKAIADGKLPGISVDSVDRVAVADDTGVAFVDPTQGTLVKAMVLAGGAHGLAVVTGIGDTMLYATSGEAEKPSYDVIAIAGTAAKDGPTDQGPGLGLKPLPGPGTWMAYDEASQQLHILGLTPGATSAAGPWTVYVVEPHGNAVYADARLPDGFVPSAWGADFNPMYPSEDRQQLLLFDEAGASAAIDTGSHAFAWRLPGVIAGAITAAILYLLTRILFRRRLVAGLVGLFVIADGMFFVQSRIGMNDVYVGLFIVAAYTVFAAVWTGWWKGRAAFWISMPVIGVLLGLALASKWVAAYAIGALLLLILVRSALGRVLAILGMIGITSILGYMAISVPPATAGADPGLGNLTFLLIMVALTLLAVVVAVVHPIAWTDDEMRFGIAAPAAAGALVFFGALAAGKLNATLTVGSLAVTPLLMAVALALGSLLVFGLFWLGGRLGFGPLAPPPAPDDPIRLLDPPGPAAEGWLRPGWLLGVPVVWALVCLVALPVAVYIVSYIPWAMIENHQLIPGWPPGHTGQTLLDLTGQMYGYHNSLADAHPASSPWWAWPFDLKPVWFYQESLAGGTAAALYDAGSLVIWWMGIPAMAFISWMAFKRRSLALTIIAVGFAAQWIPWARIDRAAFQYHYYTALPFVVMALAYFAAELWHGASRHTWALARIGGAVAVIGPALMWLLDRPLCWFVGVERVNAGSAACPAVIPQFVLTQQTGALALVMGLGLVVIVRLFLAFQSDDLRDGTRGFLSSALGRLVAAGAVFIGALLVAARLPDSAILTLTNVPVDPIALVVAIPLGYFALQVYAARDARRFVVGLCVAVVGWFAILYPNISALPLPSAVVAAYQGILPTYLYAFQFPVSTVTRGGNTPVFTSMLAILVVALVVTCLVVAYSAWVWRLSLAENAAGETKPDDAESLARSGGA